MVTTLRKIARKQLNHARTWTWHYYSNNHATGSGDVDEGVADL